MLTAIKAGWAFSVSVSSASGPSHISFDKLLAERFIHFGENGAGRGRGISERLAHADGLAALSRKNESKAHGLSLVDSMRRTKHAEADEVKLRLSTVDP